MFRRKKIILDLVETLGGVFPGDKELWYPYTVIWTKENPETGKPDPRTLKNIQKALLDSGQLKAIIFSFKNSKGLRFQKKILALPDIEPGSVLVQDLQKKMIDADAEVSQPGNHRKGAQKNGWGRWIAIFREPALAAIIRQNRKGRPVEHELSKDPKWSKFEYGVNRVLEWEKRGHSRSTEDRGFINHTFSTLTVAREESSGPIRWDHRLSAAYDMENPPAYDAQSLEGHEMNPRAKKRPKVAGKPTDMFKTRSLSSLTPRESSTGPARGRAVVTGMYGQVTKRRRVRRARVPPTGELFSPEDDRRLLTAVTVVRTLVGGVNRLIDFVIVAKILPGFDMATIQRRWSDIRQRHMAHMEKLQAEFQSVYIAAYHAGLVPPLDYEDLANHDWNWLVDWADKYLDAPSPETVPTLPARRQDLEGVFEVRREPEPSARWRDEFFGLLAPALRKMKLVSDKSWSLVTPEEASSEEDDSQMRVARSWIRANTIAAEETYDPESAKRRLLSLGEERLDLALNQMRDMKLLTHANKGRHVEGRNFDVTDTFLHCLKKNFAEVHFVKAAAAKAELDGRFRETGSAEFSYFAEDAEVLAITNMVAHRRVQLRARSAPGDRFGLLDGDYKTRLMDKARLHVELEMRPTSTYVYGNPLQPSPPAPHPHLADAGGAIPAWYDIHGHFVAAMWVKSAAAVASLVAMRPGVTVTELGRCLGPTLEAWEIAWVVRWMGDAGAAAESGGGWAVREWWWLLLPGEAQ
ncbi:MAG: RNA polymerase III transcription initiation factor complex subunit [Thelocarpon impressellum]|nr:MAG: RNA polymerase III transcription initiation factor complex subunit [Thelocarpon impressellum]